MPDDDTLTLTLIAERVRTRRMELGLTQLALADHSGLGRSAIASIEGGFHTASLLAIVRIAAALGVTVSDLVGETIARRPPLVRIVARPAVECGRCGELGVFDNRVLAEQVRGEHVRHHLEEQ